MLIHRNTMNNINGQCIQSQVYSFGCNLHGALGSGRCGSQEQAERVLGRQLLCHLFFAIFFRKRFIATDIYLVFVTPVGHFLLI